MHHSDNYNGLPLSYSNDNNQGSYVEIIRAIEAVMACMLQHHARVFFTMFVLKYPANTAGQYPDNNVLMSRLVEALTKYCARHNYHPKYLWVRECPSTGQPHYHFMLLLDENYVQNAYGIHSKATELWQRCLGIENGQGLVHLCTTRDNNIDPYGGVKIRRNAPDFQQVYQQCFQRASYMAKCFSKGNAPAYVNEYGCSRLS